MSLSSVSRTASVSDSTSLYVTDPPRAAPSPAATMVMFVLFRDLFPDALIRRSAASIELPVTDAEVLLLYVLRSKFASRAAPCPVTPREPVVFLM